MNTDKILAYAQVGLAFFFAAGFIGSFFVLIFYHGALSQTENTLLTGLLGVLGTIVTQQNGYFFSRQRLSGIPVDAPLVTPPEKSK